MAGIRILVFSDDAASRERLASALRRCGAQILTAAPGAHAVQACEAFRPQLIVAARVPYAECAVLIDKLRTAGVAGTALAVSPAVDPLASAHGADRRHDQRFEEELTGLLIRLFGDFRDSL